MCIFAKRAMRSEIDMYKGIRPGKIVGLELQERNLSQRAFAAAIDEHKQTLNAVITGRRKLTVEMALKIEKALGYDEGFLLTLQAYYEIAGKRTNPFVALRPSDGCCSGTPISTR